MTKKSIITSLLTVLFIASGINVQAVVEGQFYDCCKPMHTWHADAHGQGLDATYLYSTNTAVYVATPEGEVIGLRKDRLPGIDKLFVLQQQSQRKTLHSAAAVHEQQEQSNALPAFLMFGCIALSVALIYRKQLFGAQHPSY